jgi:hypothetical protein
LINHVTGFVAPVDKKVTYGTIMGIPGEPTKCWITSNLGASHQGTAVNDATEASAGWYWQFNRKQGYKHDGTNRTPNTTWIANIDETSDWLLANDPCNLELGKPWHVPTYTEWHNVFNGSGWVNWNELWNSGLKLHAAGVLYYNDGSLGDRGSYGYFWSSTQSSSTHGYSVHFGSSGIATDYGGIKPAGFTIRCLSVNCSLPLSPTEGTHNSSPTTIRWKWNIASGATGYKWSLSNDYSTAIDMGVLITKTETGLTCNTSYTRYVWAYNSCSNSEPLTITATTSPCSFTCGQTIAVNHVAGVVAPVNKTVNYGTVSNIPGDTNKCWITKNLGATQQATAVSEATEASAGWYWQFNRKQGYKHDGTNRTPNTTWIANIDETSDWLLANDPCNLELGKPWHVPTYTEWHNVFNGSGWVNWNELWNSGLKLHAAGVLYYDNGSLGDRGSYGYYWSSTQSSSTHGYSVHFGSSGIATDYGGIKPAGFTIRCLSGDCSLPLSPSEGTHNSSLTTIIWKWNNVPGATGYKWSTSNDYATATDMGPLLTKTETGLTCNTNYSRYVWAYNICGNSVHLTINATTSPCTFTCGQTIVVNHVAGGVAPVNKTVNYGTVTNIPGETTKCWITKNLGATQQATTVSDATEASAGWYWQFNRKQGYKHEGTTLTPGWTITSISENSDWLTANDPCTIELGTPWRLPTYTEWYNVDNTGGWTNWNGPWNSGLKLHAAGRLYTSSGSLGSRGANGKYWSSTQGGATNSWHLDFGIGGSSVYGYDKACGFSARCLRD